MIHIPLPPSKASRLETEFRFTKNRTFRDRLPIVLMAHRGRPRQDIAKDLRVHRQTVSRWLNAYCDRGLDGLRPKTAPGKPASIPHTFARQIRPRVIDGPAKQGLDRANGTPSDRKCRLPNNTHSNV